WESKMPTWMKVWAGALTIATVVLGVNALSGPSTDHALNRAAGCILFWNIVVPFGPPDNAKMTCTSEVITKLVQGAEKDIHNCLFAAQTFYNETFGRPKEERPPRVVVTQIATACTMLATGASEAEATTVFVNRYGRRDK